MMALNVSLPTTFTRVTDHMEHIILFIQGIINNGLAYVTEDGKNVLQVCFTLLRREDEMPNVLFLVLLFCSNAVGLHVPYK